MTFRGIRLTRDSWNTTIVTQNIQKVRPWPRCLQESEVLMLQTVPPYVDAPSTDIVLTMVRSRYAGREDAMNDTMTQTSEPQAAPPAAPHPLLGFLFAQFLGAFNDHIYKMVLSLFAVSMAVGTSDGSGYIPAIGAIFVLPYLLFSGYAGHLQMRRSKRQVLIYTKLLEIGAMALGCLAFWSANMAFMLVVLFLISLQSALFSPAKYGIIPEIVPLTSLSRC